MFRRRKRRQVALQEVLELPQDGYVGSFRSGVAVAHEISRGVLVEHPEVSKPFGVQCIVGRRSDLMNNAG